MKRTTIVWTALFIAMLAGIGPGIGPVSARDSVPKDLWDRVEHHNADSSGVKIHYVALGKGPLIVMIHGFPDFWYTWRKQMDALSARYRVVAVDRPGSGYSVRTPGASAALGAQRTPPPHMRRWASSTPPRRSRYSTSRSAPSTSVRTPMLRKSRSRYCHFELLCSTKSIVPLCG